MISKADGLASARVALYPERTIVIMVTLFRGVGMIKVPAISISEQKKKGGGGELLVYLTNDSQCCHRSIALTVKRWNQGCSEVTAHDSNLRAGVLEIIP